MKAHAEDLNVGPLYRLTMMIKDKQQVKKNYQSMQQHLEAEMYKVILKCRHEFVLEYIFSLCINFITYQL